MQNLSSTNFLPCEMFCRTFLRNPKGPQNSGEPLPLGARTGLLRTGFFLPSHQKTQDFEPRLDWEKNENCDLEGRKCNYRKCNFCWLLFLQGKAWLWFGDWAAILWSVCHSFVAFMPTPSTYLLWFGNIHLHSLPLPFRAIVSTSLVQMPEGSSARPCLTTCSHLKSLLAPASVPKMPGFSFLCCPH